MCQTQTTAFDRLVYDISVSQKAPPLKNFDDVFACDYVVWSLQSKILAMPVRVLASF